jgi:plastocyanin
MAILVWLYVFCVPGLYSAAAQEKPVTAHVKLEKQSQPKAAKSAPSDSAGVVVWLVPAEPGADRISGAVPGKRPEIVQRNKSFHPHLAVVRVGSVVDFPNRDPFFHNVFSLFDGKRFDLGLYEAGATNSVRFDHPGVSFLFCNIHPEMSAVVVAVDTPYYGISDRSGNVSIGDLPDGKYELHVWYERGVPEELKALSRSVHISTESRDVGTITVAEDPAFSPAHKNKYGQDYPPPPAPGYPQP